MCSQTTKLTASLEWDMGKGKATLPFLLHLVGRPVHQDEPMPSDDALSMKKLPAEATPAGHQIMLGWDAGPHTAHAPLTEPCNKGKATYSELDTLIGRLNHASCVAPGGRHFLGRQCAQDELRLMSSLLMKQQQIFTFGCVV